jgi:hypothetical protein
MKLTILGIVIAALVGTSPAFAQISSKTAGQQLQNQGAMVDTLSAKKKKKTKTKKMDDSMGTGNASKPGASVDKDDSQKMQKK